MLCKDIIQSFQTYVTSKSHKVHGFIICYIGKIQLVATCNICYITVYRTIFGYITGYIPYKKLYYRLCPSGTQIPCCEVIYNNGAGALAGRLPAVVCKLAATVSLPAALVL